MTNSGRTSISGKAKKILWVDWDKIDSLHSLDKIKLGLNPFKPKQQKDTNE